MIIIGAGISGTVTAYHVLRDTPHRVVLLDAHRVGHGASGRNAGLLVADIERPLKELVEIFGSEEVKKGIRALDSSWNILEEMCRDLRIQTPLYPCHGYHGFATLPALLAELENCFWWREAGVPFTPFRLARTSTWLSQIPDRYAGLWEVVDAEEILGLLEHDGEEFEAIGHMRMSCGNSALLSEEIVQKLMQRFGSRFSLFEDTHVTEVLCREGSVHVRAGSIGLDAKWAVLCTNGFEQFHIKDANGGLLDLKFHHLVTGEVAYMEGFLDDVPQPTEGFIYLESETPSEDPYVYASRRPFEFDTRPKTLVCVGGPELILPEGTNYDPYHPFPERVAEDIARFLRSKQRVVPSTAQPTFRWHGLMGYTPNRVRCIGFEPCQPSLLYNLGCNGIGLMPSMYGGWKIAQLLIDKDDDVRMFDPQDRRCVLPQKTR